MSDPLYERKNKTTYLISTAMDSLILEENVHQILIPIDDYDTKTSNEIYFDSNADTLSTQKELFGLIRASHGSFYQTMQLVALTFALQLSIWW